MSKLEEIEAAVETLPVAEKEKLMLFLAANMRSRGVTLPEPQVYSRKEIEEWVQQDETEMRRFKSGQ